MTKKIALLFLKENLILAEQTNSCFPLEVYTKQWWPSWQCELTHCRVNHVFLQTAALPEIVERLWRCWRVGSRGMNACSCDLARTHAWHPVAKVCADSSSAPSTASSGRLRFFASVFWEGTELSSEQTFKQSRFQTPQPAPCASAAWRKQGARWDSLLGAWSRYWLWFGGPGHLKLSTFLKKKGSKKYF